MEGDEYEEETYIHHLRCMFDELDSDNKGGLNREELKTLSDKLSLERNQCDLLLQLSFGADTEPATISRTTDANKHVNFNKFQESFVAVLSATADMPMSNSESEEEDAIGTRDFNDNESLPISDIKPRVMRGGKAYGRRSHPDVFDSEVLAGCEEIKKGRINSQASEANSEADDNVFDNGFYELPEGKSTRLYYEASGQLRNPLIDRVKQSAANLNESQSNVSMTSAVFQVHHLFGDLDKNETGLVDRAELFDMWKREGVINPRQVLQILDVSVDSDKLVNAFDLTSVLESEATSFGMAASDPVLQAVLATYRHQLTHLNGQVENHQVLLGKMKDDLEKSELRNSKLVDEVDDRYLHVDKNQAQILSNAEKQFNKKLRQARKNFEKDRDLLQTQAMRERDVLQQEIERLTIREESLRSTINALQLDNDALEQESRELVKKLQQSDTKVARLQKDLECLLNEKVTGLNDPHNTSQEERFAVIIKEYEAQCRALSDRNDELVAELEKVRGEFLQSMRGKSKNSESEIDTSESKAASRKRARRRTSDIYTEGDVDDVCESNDEDEVTKANMCKKISELEKANQEMREEREIMKKEMHEERARLMTKLSGEKLAHRDQLQSEFLSKLEEEKKKLASFQESTKTGQDAAIHQALAEARKEKEELERRVSELRTALEDEQRNGQQSITDLCREFESDKSEMQKVHDEKVEECNKKLSALEQQWQEEIKLHQTSRQQLQADRRQHEATLRTHSETVAALEKSLKCSANEENGEILRMKAKLTSLEKELSIKEVEKNKIKSDYEQELQDLKDETKKKIEDVVSQKQQEAHEAVCEDLRSIQQRVAAERQLMKDRVAELKKSFEIDAQELRTLLDLEKNEFRKMLSEESKSLKKKLEAESQKELERKRRQIEGEHKRENEKQICILQDTITELKKSKVDLESRLSDALAEKNKYKREIQEDRSQEDISRLQRTLDEKDSLVQVLHKQAEELREKHLDVSRELHEIRTEYERKDAELTQVVKEKEECSRQLLATEQDMSACQIDNSQLNAKIIELGKCNSEIDLGEKEKVIFDLQSRLGTSETECLELKKELSGLREVTEIVHERGIRTKDVNSKYEGTRSQLLQQMKKTKEMYSELAKSEKLIKELYCENAQLMHALQATEGTQKACERKLAVESDKNLALTTLLRKICPEAV